MIKELLLKEEDRHLKMIYKNLEMVKYELLHDFNRSLSAELKNIIISLTSTVATSLSRKERFLYVHSIEIQVVHYTNLSTVQSC